MKQYRSSRIAAVPATVTQAVFRHQSWQCQRKRSKLALLLVPVSIVITLIVVANLFALCSNSSSNNNSNITIDTAESPSVFQQQVNRKRPRQQQQQQQQQQGADDLFHREISVLEYNDILAQERQTQDEETQTHDDDDAAVADEQWSPEQMEEIEKYYKRYLQVFLEQHGEDYEPEEKEVVYKEYLIFKERKAIEFQEREAAAAALAQQARADKAEQLQKEQQQRQQQAEQKQAAAVVVTDHRRNDTTNSRRVIADQIMVKPAPHTLEIVEADFNDNDEAAREDLYYHIPSNNYTESLTIVAVSTLMK